MNPFTPVLASSFVAGARSFQFLSRDLSHPAKKRHHGQTLHEDGKSDDSKADRDDLFAHRDIGRKSKGERQRQGPAQAAPKQDVLMFQ